MPRSLKIAAIQMDVSPTPTSERLARAERLVVMAAQAGARLVVMPELFNTGYAYSNENFQRAERPNGPTAAWMCATAARLNIHLAGTLLLLDPPDIYNALLLDAPDGQSWRYDKTYPWGWERAYFREGRGPTVAHTTLGDLGLMICWDTAHRNLWRSYAGRVDLIVVCSCPPDFANPTYLFANGDKVNPTELGPVFARLKDAGRRLFGEMINQQTAWLGVPLVNTVASGKFVSGLPNARATWLASLPTAPWLAKYVPLAGQVKLTCGMTEGTKVVDAAGQTLAGLTLAQGETLTVAEVMLPDTPPEPRGPQPRARVADFSYLVADRLLPWLSRPVYTQGLRQAVSDG